MKQVDEMPTSGEFVAVWECEFEIHGYKMQWRRGILYEINESTQDLYEIDCVESLIKYHIGYGAKYFIAE